MTKRKCLPNRAVSVAVSYALMLIGCSAANGSDYRWDVNGLRTSDRGYVADLFAQVYTLNDHPFIGFTLYPYETDYDCAFATIGENAHKQMPYTLDDTNYEAYVFCEQYADDAGHYYTFVTMDDDFQKHIIERFATELGQVELRFDGMIFDLPTVGFNSAYRERTK